jgi:hypothetical protein
MGRRRRPPQEIEFKTKPQIALEQIRTARAAGILRGVVLEDSSYGSNSALRAAAAGVTTVLAAGAVTPSLAAMPHIRDHAQTHHARDYNAYAAARPRFGRNQRPGGGWFAHGAPDDPPGPAFQTFGIDQSMGFGAVTRSTPLREAE